MIRLAPLARYGGKAVRWQPLAAALLVTGVVLAVVLARPHDPLTWRGAIWSLRAIAVLLTLAAVFVLDDAAADVVAPVPVPLWVRTTLRAVFALAWIAPAWAVALLVLTPRLPRVWVLWSTLELAALLAAGLALAAALARGRRMREPGVAAAPGTAGLWLLILTLPGPVALFTLREGDWAAAHLRWSVLLLVGLGVLAWMVRDPGRGSIRLFTRNPDK